MSDDRAGSALVTGGAVRVGRAVALGLAEAGWDVALHHHSSVEEAEEVAARVRSAGRSAVLVRADLSDTGEIPGMVRRAADALEGLDLLVNNAAVFPRADPSDVTEEHWDRVFAVNARAPFFCAREAARVMREERPDGAAPGGGTAAPERLEEGPGAEAPGVEGEDGDGPDREGAGGDGSGGEDGCIVNIADVAAFEAWPSYAPYAATKAALVSLTRSLAAAWAPRIRVNAVAPGPVLLPEGSPPEEERRARRSTLLGRIGQAADVAGAVLYLAGADFVTGEVLRVDGGEHVARTTRR